MKARILISLRDFASSYRPDVKWAEDIQNKFRHITSATFGKIGVLNKMIRAEVELTNYETLSDEIARIIDEDCRVLIYIPGKYNLFLSKSHHEGFRQELYAKGYPTLHCGLIIERRSCNASINDVILKSFFIDRVHCDNVYVKTYKKGWKVFFDISSVLYEEFVDMIGDELNISAFQLYLDQNDSSFRDWFEYEYVVVEIKNEYADDESAIMSSLANGEGYKFGLD